jgi:hypothetical protein
MALYGLFDPFNPSLPPWAQECIVGALIVWFVVFILPAPFLVLGAYLIPWINGVLNLMVRKGVTTVMLIAGALLFFISRGIAFVHHG